MSNGQWEVVGKNKKDKSGQNGKIKSKDDKKNGPKLEDILTNTQIKAHYAGLDIEEKKSGKENKKKDDQKKPKKQDKKLEPPKPKPPKTIEAALLAIDADELSSLIASNKIRFSNAPLVWLKEVANFLNSKTQIDVDDPTFSNQPYNYPMNVLPDPIRSSLEILLHDAGKSNTQLFFDVTLTALANDLSRGLSVNGYRLLLQMLAHEYPEFCVSSLLKSANLRNSYQNRPPIGLSLLWAFGQGGHEDFTVGLQAWEELFLPIIELKNYSKYIVIYLTNLLDRHIKMKSAKMSQEQYFNFLDTISNNNKKNGLPKELSSDLNKQLIKVKNIYFNNSGNKLQVTFNQLMKKMPNQYIESNNLDSYQNVLVDSLVDCLERDDSCNATWRQLFVRCSKQSATLMCYISRNWESVSNRLKQKSFKASVIHYKEVCGDALKGKKKDETVFKANKICQDILDRMKVTRRFPWLWASFILLVSIGVLVAFDISRVGGNLSKSATGCLLNDLGILEQTQHAWRKSLSTSARGYIWLENNAPVYYAQTIEVSKPYIELGRDLTKVGFHHACNLYGNVKEYVVETAPLVYAKVEEYSPGLIDNVSGFLSSRWAFTKEYSVYYYKLTSDLLKQKVFIGQLSPENIAEVTHTAVNVTRHRLTNGLVWLRQQIHLYSEIP